MVIYTARLVITVHLLPNSHRRPSCRPQTIGKSPPGIYISEALKRTDSAHATSVSESISSAMDVINAAVIEHAQTSRSSGHRSKRARIDANGEHIADTEQVASSAAAKSSSRLDPEIVPLTPGMTPVPPVPTTDAHLNGCGKQKFEGAGNPPCTRCWSAGLECLCDKLSIEAATVTESDSE